MKLEFAVGFFSLAVMAVALCLTLTYCTGCVPEAVSVENAAAVAQYKLLLVDCRKQGKEAGSYAVYERCADEVDRTLCRESSLRCKDGGQ
jgi:hypothetical protein